MAHTTKRTRLNQTLVECTRVGVRFELGLDVSISYTAVTVDHFIEQVVVSYAFAKIRYFEEIPDHKIVRLLHT